MHVFQQLHSSFLSHSFFGGRRAKIPPLWETSRDTIVLLRFLTHEKRQCHSSRASVVGKKIPFISSSSYSFWGGLVLFGNRFPLSVGINYFQNKIISLNKSMWWPWREEELPSGIAQPIFNQTSTNYSEDFKAETNIIKSEVVLTYLPPLDITKNNF